MDQQDRYYRANDAGSENAHRCTLILTEGMSAKSFAMAGLKAIGMDQYGIFALGGKLLNVRTATQEKILKNDEINKLMIRFGLQYNKKYLTKDDLKSLRYGKVMVMSDQDEDGSHIKGLVINFVHYNWPELLCLDFIEGFITPILKAIQGKEKILFYSVQEFEKWRTLNPNHKYEIKYLNGVRSSNSEEAMEYFQNIENHRVIFIHEGKQDDDSISLAFSKSREAIDQRKKWVKEYMETTPKACLYAEGKRQFSYTEFEKFELVKYFIAKNTRSLPSVVDGLKPGQRKIMHTAFELNGTFNVKAEQLSTYVSVKCEHNHGERRLQKSAAYLANDYVGTNNISLLVADGTSDRDMGPKHFDESRYISIQKSELSRLIFHPDDDPLLNFEEGFSIKKIEPTLYIPIIPMVLVNGAEGIGSCWSTKIPNHNPMDIIKNLRLMIHDKEPEPMDPWYKGFKGSIGYISEHEYVSNGVVSILGDNKIAITELPVGTWTQDYENKVLNPLLHGKKSIITNISKEHPPDAVKFVVTVHPDEFDRLRQEEEYLDINFKLSKKYSTKNMYGFDYSNCLRRFETATQILKEFFPIRLEFYEKRKKYLMSKLQGEALNALQTKSAKMLWLDDLNALENKLKEDQAYLLSPPQLPKNVSFTCRVCGKLFGSKIDMQRHMVVHTGEKQFKCRVCTKAFKRTSHRNRHERALHADGKAFKCRICTKAFSCNLYLIKHEKRVHGREPRTKKIRGPEPALLSFPDKEATGSSRPGGAGFPENETNEELFEEFVEEDLEDLDEEEAAEPLQSRGPSASFHFPSSDPHLDNSPRSPALAPNEELHEEFVEEDLEDLDEEEAAEPLQSRGPTASFHIPSSDPHLDNSPRSPALAPNEELYEEFVEEDLEDLDEEEAAEPLQSRGPTASFHIPSSDPHLDNSPRSPALAPNEELYEEFVEEDLEDLDEEEAAEPLQSRGPTASFHSCQDVVSPCEPWYECDWEGCGKRYKLPCHLRAHVQRTHGEKKFECPEVLRKYMRQDILSAHMNLSKRCGTSGGGIASYSAVE